MSYIRKAEPHEKSRRLLLGHEVTAAKLAVWMRWSLPTARDRLRNPGKLTGNEWLVICRMGHIPIEEVREVILS